MAKLVEGLQAILMSLMYEKMMKGKWMSKQNVVPRVHQKIETYKEEYRKYVVAPSSEFLHDVS